MIEQSNFNIILLADFSNEVYLSRPLGVHKVAAVLREHGYDVQVVNFLHVFSVEEIKKILKQLINDKTLFVGFNPFFYLTITDDTPISDGQWAWEQGGIKYGPKQLGAMLPHGIAYNSEIIDLIKSCNPNCKTVLGGPDAQDAPYIKDYDYAVIGYADTSVVNLANYLSKGTPLEQSYKSIHRPILVDDRKAETYDFVNSPLLFHKNDLIIDSETLPIEISRGCVFRCAFCSYPLNGKKKNDHIKLEDVLYKEFMHNYENFNVTRYIFSDDTFNDSVDKIKMIYELSKKLPFKLQYWAYIRLDLLAAHPETIDMLFDSGLIACHCGIETLNPDAAKAIGKGGSRTKLSDTLHYIKNKYGSTVTLNGSFIFGLPKESVDSMIKTAETLLSGTFGLDSWNIYPLSLNDKTSNYLSDLDTNYAKYGYILNQQHTVGKWYQWVNSETNFAQCLELSRHYNKYGNTTGNKKVSGLDALGACTNGVKLEDLLNKTVPEIDWHAITLKKEQAANGYKRRLFDLIGISD